MSADALNAKKERSLPDLQTAPITESEQSEQQRSDATPLYPETRDFVNGDSRERGNRP